MKNISFSFYDTGRSPIINLLYPDLKERTKKISSLVWQDRYFELKGLETEVDRNITKEQLNKKLIELRLGNYIK